MQRHRRATRIVNLWGNSRSESTETIVEGKETLTFRWVHTWNVAQDEARKSKSRLTIKGDMSGNKMSL